MQKRDATGLSCRSPLGVLVIIVVGMYLHIAHIVIVSPIMWDTYNRTENLVKGLVGRTAQEGGR